MSNEKERNCGNCCFGLKDPKARATMRFCGMSKDHDMHFATQTAAELKCKHHLFKKGA